MILIKDKFVVYSILFTAFLSLTGCGGGGGSSSSSQVTQTSQTPVISLGRLVDSPIIGIQYQSGSQSGYTDKYGFYKYETGQNTTFKIGDIVVGTVAPTSFSTPVKMVPGATDETNSTVVNILRFLQSLDDDGDPSNGITITSAMNTAATNISINFNQTVSAFAADTNVQNAIATITAVSTAGSRNLIAQNTALTNFKTSIYSNLTGTYCGTYSGDQNGSWTINVDSIGVVTGTGNSTALGAFTITGNVKTDGSASFQQKIGGSASGATFTGDFDFSSGISGTWVENSNNWSGTFSGDLSHTNCKTQQSNPSGTLASATQVTYDVYNGIYFDYYRANGAPADLFRPHTNVVTVSGLDMRREDTGTSWAPVSLGVPPVFGRIPFDLVYTYKNNVLDYYDVLLNSINKNIGLLPVSSEYFISFFVQDIPLLSNKITLVDGAINGDYVTNMNIAGYSCNLYKLSANASNVLISSGNEVCIADLGGGLKTFLYLKLTGEIQDSNGQRKIDFIVRARKVDVGKTVDSAIFQVP